MGSPRRLIPTLVRTAMFKVFEYYNKQDGDWVLDTARSGDLSGDVNKWIRQSYADVQQISAPSVVMYNESPDSRLLIVSLSLTYFSPAEGTEDECRHNGKNVGGVVGAVQPKSAESASVYKPPATD